jgi:xanthine/uracil permease
MIPLVAPTMLDHLPGWAAPFTHSGITLAAITAVALNLLFNGGRQRVATVATRSTAPLPEPVTSAP